MSRIDRKGRSRGDVRHVRLDHWLLKTAAWQSLSPAARVVYIELKVLFNGRNNGDLFLSCRTAAEAANVGKNTANAALQELQSKGFIRPYAKGAFRVKDRQATTWILTECPYGGREASKDFARWSPTIPHFPKKFTVPPEGQAVPPAGQMTGKRKDVTRTVPDTGQIPADSAAYGPATGTHIVYQGGRERCR